MQRAWSCCCALRLRPRLAARNDPELEVQLTNSSDETVTLTIHQHLLDTVTIILRDPDGYVVSSLCYVVYHSAFSAKPPLVLGAGLSKTSQLHLSVAVGPRAFRHFTQACIHLRLCFTQDGSWVFRFQSYQCSPVPIGLQCASETSRVTQEFLQLPLPDRYSRRRSASCSPRCRAV